VFSILLVFVLGCVDIVFIYVCVCVMCVYVCVCVCVLAPSFCPITCRVSMSLTTISSAYFFAPQELKLAQVNEFAECVKDTYALMPAPLQKEEGV